MGARQLVQGRHADRRITQQDTAQGWIQTALSAFCLVVAVLLGAVGVALAAWSLESLEVPFIALTRAISWWMLFSFSCSMLRGRYTAAQPRRT